MFVPYASKIWSKSYGPIKLREILSFWQKKKQNKTKQKQKKQKQKKKNVFCYNHFWQRDDAILEDVSEAKIIV